MRSSISEACNSLDLYFCPASRQGKVNTPIQIQANGAI